MNPGILKLLADARLCRAQAFELSAAADRLEAEAQALLSEQEAEEQTVCPACGQVLGDEDVEWIETMAAGDGPRRYRCLKCDHIHDPSEEG